MIGARLAPRLSLRLRAVWRDRVRRGFSPRARLGVLALALVLVVLAWLELDASSARLRDEIARAQSASQLQLEAGAVESWREKAARAEAALDVLSSRLWTGDTQGIVAARIEGYLRDLPALEGARNLRIRVDPEPVDLEGQPVLRYELSAILDEGVDSVRLLAGMLGGDRMLTVEQLNFSFSRLTGATATVEGYAPFQLAGEAGA